MIRNAYSQFLVLLALIGFSLFNTASAMESEWDRNDHVSVRLISAVKAVGDLQELPLGLEFEMAKDWKIYWRNPGDAGYPPQPDWFDAINLERSDIKWPLPNRFSILGLESLGYKEHVILPLTVTPQKIGEAIRLKGDINYLTCADICIPYTASLDLTLPAGDASPSEYAFPINQYLSEVPTIVDFNADNPIGLKVTQTALEKENGDDKVSIFVESNQSFDNLDMLIEGPYGSFFDPPAIQLLEDGKSAIISVLGGGFDAEMRETKKVTFTVSTATQAIETSTYVSDDTSWLSAHTQTVSLLSLDILLIALLGGFILNLMPCVLPVLSLKVLSIINHGESSSAKIRVSFLATTAGIMVAFLVLAGILAGLKAGGIAIGWGIQFQQPIFLIFMLFVVMGFAASLLGFFEIQLPSQLATSASNASQGTSLKGHFLTGVFATLLATPCSAPFLGTAVGFALSQGSTEIFVIFTALGIGLASPYILFMIFPSLARKLPKPGKWMGWVKVILALALIATAIWLVTVLITSVGSIMSWIAFGLSALMLAILYLRKRSDYSLHRKYALVSLIPILVGFTLPFVLPTAPQAATKLAHSNIEWVTFERGKIAELTAQGKTVFIDVTADWCITCQYNKRSTLTDSDIADWLNQDDVIAMQADWTLPDDAILNYLQEYGRYGIPFNIIYSPKRPDGVILPELLTVSNTLEKIEESKSATSN